MAWDETNVFIRKGHENFSDKADLANAHTKILKTPWPMTNNMELIGDDIPQVSKIINTIPEPEYIAPNLVQKIFKDAALGLGHLVT